MRRTIHVKTVIGVIAVLLAVALVVVGIVMANRKKDIPDTDTPAVTEPDGTEPTVPDVPDRPDIPTEPTEPTKPEPPEPTDPEDSDGEEEPEGEPDVTVDVGDKKQVSGRWEEPGIEGEVIVAPGVKGEDE